MEKYSMNNYIVYISRYNWRKNPQTKRIEILAKNTLDAINKITERYKDWDINMFWLDWKASIS